MRADGVQLRAHRQDVYKRQPYRYGIRFLTASPRQDFRDLDSRTGLGGGLFVEAPAGSGWIAQTLSLIHI